MTAHRHDGPQDFDPAPVRANNGESFELRLGSRRLRVTGGATLMIVILAAALGFIVWTDWKSSMALSAAIEQRSVEHGAILNELKQNREEGSYILTLDQAHRDQIRDRLRVPDRFR